MLKMTQQEQDQMNATIDGISEILSILNKEVFSLRTEVNELKKEIEILRHKTSRHTLLR